MMIIAVILMAAAVLFEGLGFYAWCYNKDKRKSRKMYAIMWALIVASAICAIQ